MKELKLSGFLYSTVILLMHIYSVRNNLQALPHYLKLCL